MDRYVGIDYLLVTKHSAYYIGIWRDPKIVANGSPLSIMKHFYTTLARWGPVNKTYSGPWCSCCCHGSGIRKTSNFKISKEKWENMFPVHTSRTLFNTIYFKILTIWIQNIRNSSLKRLKYASLREKSFGLLFVCTTRFSNNYHCFFLDCILLMLFKIF